MQLPPTLSLAAEQHRHRRRALLYALNTLHERAALESVAEAGAGAV
jgi:hypothetical protein